ncbi:hypothetical protein PRIPAC_80896, partial [Pristionchus pacificus]|uniref:Uncharacterized protein n=1 Tax=Pristionchus pacificus TaxID=54126 RepID=A0A2A6CPJ0_PRIPA
SGARGVRVSYLMELCTTLLVLFSLSSAAIACIPMKHVDPGIPAVPGCPVFNVNRADCDTITGSPAGGCLAPTHTSMTLACPTGRIVVVGGNYPQMLTAFAYSPSARCDMTAKMWVFRDQTNTNDVTQAQLEAMIGAPLEVACQSF